MTILQPTLHYTHVSLLMTPAAPTPSHSKKGWQKRKALKSQYKQNNDRYIRNLSDTTLTDQDKTLLSKGLKLIPTPPKPNSQKSNQRLQQFHQKHMLKIPLRWSQQQTTPVPRQIKLATATTTFSGTWKNTWHEQNMRLLQYRSAIRRTIYQQKNEKPLKSLAQTQRWTLKKLTRETPQSLWILRGQWSSLWHKLLHPSTGTNRSIHG